jgi:two-component system cell cycle sensor histidine kinase/response regulator CckA
LKSSPGPRLAVAFILFGVVFMVGELSFLSPSAPVTNPPQIGHTPDVRPQTIPSCSLQVHAEPETACFLVAAYSNSIELPRKFLPTRVVEDAGSHLGVIVASTPDVVLILTTFLFLATSVRYRQQLRVSQTRLAAVLESRDEKTTEEASPTGEGRFRTLVENSANALILFDPEGKILYCNRASERILGHEPERLVGRQSFDCIHENDHAMVQAALQQCIANPGGSITVRARVLHRDGSSRLLEGAFNNLLDDPDVQAVVNNYRDVTEAAAAEAGWRESEERFAKAFRSGPLAISISTQAEGRYLDVNEAFLQMLGYERGEVIGSSSMELNIWEDQEDRTRMLEQLNDSRTARGLRARFRTKSGEIREVNVSTEPIELDGLPCVLAITQDVTEAKRLEDQFRQSQKMEAVGRLAGGLAHDFNNMLGVIMGYSELSLERLDLAHPLFKNVAEIKKAAERAASLTRQLLAFTRQQILYPRILDLNEVVKNLNNMLLRMIGEDVSLSFRPVVPLGSVRVDLGQIEQILMNLIVNARDAMPKGGEITIETSNVELDESSLGAQFSLRPGRYVLLSVSDTGSGMDKKTVSHIFEPFFTTKGPGEGTGLGLSTVYGIVKQSEGYITVHSEPGLGTTFELYFPRRDEEGEESLGQDAAESQPPRGSETILVVEDDESLRKLIVRFLEGAGYRVLQAGNAEAAIDLVQSFKDSIDLVLTDMIMPTMSGLELSGHVKALRGDLKILLMSGYAGDYTARYGAIETGVLLLEKPFTRRDLLSKISTVLHE